MERTDIGSFLIGVGMGATLAMLFTPSAGTKTRAQITKAAADGASYAKEVRDTVFKEVRDTVLSAVERSKDQIARQKEGVAEAIKRGSAAYKRAVS